MHTNKKLPGEVDHGVGSQVGNRELGETVRDGIIRQGWACNLAVKFPVGVVSSNPQANAFEVISSIVQDVDAHL